MDNLLDRLKLPQDLKKLSFRQLEALCAEIRSVLIHTVSKTGGHLSSNLGVVELTVALHKTFDAPKDQIVWDVGHQSYTHKILTGRKNKMNTLRQKGGLSGFPKPAESIYDAFIAGHSSTSISVAAGLARAKSLKAEPGFPFVFAFMRVRLLREQWQRPRLLPIRPWEVPAPLRKNGQVYDLQNIWRIPD